ncbi:hypothetical protein CQW23_16274 [Capsicum baccatum]|uniref:Uncharacterized protein n=1 Tax=Capsicum baccatum TaxID=33114 RepID=A0A2G2WAP2_CAPBA|nr:hypothetical protein CQW23_16274 [Capsicum baccatum]
MGWTIDDIIGDSPEKRRSHLEEDRMPTDYAAHMSRNAMDNAPHMSLICREICAAYVVQWHLKRDKARKKATTSQKGKKRGRKEQGEPSSLQTPRLTLGIKWDTYAELMRMMTLMMIPTQGNWMLTLYLSESYAKKDLLLVRLRPTVANAIIGTELILLTLPPRAPSLRVDPTFLLPSQADVEPHYLAALRSPRGGSGFDRRDKVLSMVMKER